MEKSDLVSSLIMFGLSALILFESNRIGLGELSNPEAGFAAFWIAGVICLMSTLLAFLRIITLQRKKGISKPINILIWRRPLLIVLFLFLYTFLFKILGFPLATFILINLLMIIFGRQRPIPTLFVSTAITTLFYILFNLILRIPLPDGPIGFLIRSL